VRLALVAWRESGKRAVLVRAAIAARVAHQGRPVVVWRWSMREATCWEKNKGVVVVVMTASEMRSVVGVVE
jgi:hypothetical protein